MNGPPADVANTPPPDAPPRQAKRYRPESNALRRSIRYLVSDGFSYGIRMEGFSASANAVLKAANGTFYQRDSSPYSRYWRVPIRHFGYEGENLAQRFLQALGCRAKPTDLIAALQRAPIDRGAFTDEMMVTIKPLHPEGLAISTNHYHEGVVAISKMMGAKWMPHEKAWLLVGDDKHQAPTISSMMFNLQQELLLADDQFEITPQFKLEQQAGGDRDVVLTPFVGMLPTPIVANQDEDGRFLRKAVKQLARTKLMIADIEAGIARIDQTRTDGSRALPHQRDGIVFCAQNTGAANFDDMGLGKTQQLLYVMSIVAPGGRKLVVAPKQPLESWDNELRTLFPDSKFAVGTYEEDAEWVVVNPEILDLVEAHASKFSVLCVDEAQMIINPKAQKTGDVFKIAESIPFRYVITGTPIVNHEGELLSLLRLTGHPLGTMGTKDFLGEFGGSLDSRKKLHAALHGTWFIRRHKDDVVKLPPKHRRKVALVPTAGFMKRYNAIVRDRTILHMHKPAKFNKLSEEYKIHCLDQLIANIPPGDKVIVFTHLKEAMHSAVHRLEEMGHTCVWSDGSPTLLQRKKRMTRFRTDPACRFFVGTIDANNAGTNLQAANWVIFLNYPWTASKLLQAEDRAYRIGQAKEVFIIMPYLPGLYDERNFDRINLKHSRSRDVLEPAEQEETNKRAAAKLIRTIEEEDLAELNRSRGYATQTVH